MLQWDYLYSFFFFPEYILHFCSQTGLKGSTSRACTHEMLSEKEVSLICWASKEMTCTGGPGSQEEGKGVQQVGD